MNYPKKRKNVYISNYKKDKKAYRSMRKDYTSQIARYSSKGKEIKTLDNWSNLSQIGTVPQFFILNAPKQGSAFYNRIGSKISLKSLRMRIQLRDIPANEGVSSMFVRIMIFYDRQCNGIVPASSDLLQSVNMDGVGSTDPLGGTSIVNSERFVILRDEIVPVFSSLNSTSTAPTHLNFSMIDGQQKNYFDWFIKLKGLETKFQNNDGDEGSITTGALYLWVFSDLSTGGTNLVPLKATYNSRTRFYDD